MAIYFIQRLTDMAVKIGYSYQPQRRINQLRTEYGAIRILGVKRGDREHENELHMRFADACVGGGRRGANLTPSDWFFPIAELLAYISENTEPYADIDEIGMRFTIPLEVYNQLQLVANANGVAFADMMREIVVTVAAAYPALASPALPLSPASAVIAPARVYTFPSAISSTESEAA